MQDAIAVIVADDPVRVAVGDGVAGELFDVLVLDGPVGDEEKQRPSAARVASSWSRADSSLA